MMTLIILGFFCAAAGYVGGRLEEKESIYRRYWTKPTATLDEIRTEARKRFL